MAEKLNQAFIAVHSGEPLWLMDLWFHFLAFCLKCTNIHDNLQTFGYTQFKTESIERRAFLCPRITQLI